MDINMKQHITIKQLNELTTEEKNYLRKWWKPKKGDKFYSNNYSNVYGGLFYGELSSPIIAESYEPDKVYFAGGEGEGREKDLPLLSIGQMIEFIGDEYINVLYSSEFITTQATKVCDELWEMVKWELLEDRLENEK